MSLYYKPSTRRWAAQVASLSAFGFFATALATPASAISLVQINGHVPDLVSQSTALGVLPANQSLLIAISLPLRNEDALNDLLKGLNDPDSPHYNHYLTPTQFAAEFGPTQAQYDAVIAYLQSKGLTIAQTWPARTYLNVSGTAAQINSAFNITLKQFKSPDGRVFHSPDTEVKVPSTVAGEIAGVVGLDDANPPKPMLHIIRPVAAPSKIAKVIIPSYAIPDSTKPLVQDPGEQGTGPYGGFAPSDFRTAYGLNTTSLNGAGQTTAIIEYGTTFNIKDIVKYEGQFNLPRVPITIVPVDGGSTTYATDGPTETVLDIDMHISMSPGLSGIRVYLENSTGSVTDAINQVYADQSSTTFAPPKQLSISYGFGAESSRSTTPSSSQQALETAYKQLATAGVSVYVSAGDSGSQADSNGKTSIDISNDEPSVCSVGGTELTVQSPGVNENYLAESTWNYNNTAAGGAGGGGVSKQWTIAGSGTYDGATYQANAATASAAISGSNVSKTMRNVPDISCDASPETGAAIYVSEDPGEPGNGWTIIGGTSEAAPLWAGYTALINENRANYSLGTLGLPNNSLYPLAYTSSTGPTASYSLLFHDINDLSSNLTVTGGTNYAAVTGFDDSTGLGSMLGVNLIAALSGPTPGVSGGGGRGGGAQ